MRTKQSYINERDNLFDSYLDTINRIRFWEHDSTRIQARHRKAFMEELIACRNRISERLITLDNIITNRQQIVDIQTQLAELS